MTMSIFSMESTVPFKLSRRRCKGSILVSEGDYLHEVNPTNSTLNQVLTANANTLLRIPIRRSREINGALGQRGSFSQRQVPRPCTIPDWRAAYNSCLKRIAVSKSDWSDFFPTLSSLCRGVSYSWFYLLCSPSGASVPKIPLYDKRETLEELVRACAALPLPPPRGARPGFPRRDSTTS